MKLLLFFCLSITKASNIFYDLDVDNPSFVLFGRDLVNGTVPVIRGDPTYTIQVNGLFEELSTTDITLLTDNGTQFRKEDILNAGTKGLRLNTANISLLMTTNSSTDFYLSFAIYSNASIAASLGYDFYRLAVYDAPDNGTVSFQSNDTKNSLLTIINKKYSIESCHPFLFHNLKLTYRSCDPTIYAGGAPFLSGDTYEVYYKSPYYDQSEGLPLILSAAYYTIAGSCSDTFELSDYVEGTPIERKLANQEYAYGYAVSCEYPGMRFSRKEPIKSTNLLIRVTDRNDHQLSVTSRAINPGQGGHLGLQILENNQPVVNENLTIARNFTIYGQGLSLNWVPGDSKSSRGYLVSYFFAAGTINYFSVAKNPLIFYPYNWRDAPSRIESNGSDIQITFASSITCSNLYFSDDNKNLSCTQIQILDTPQLFQDYVLVTRGANYVEDSTLVMAFTSVNRNDSAQRSAMGLDSYSLTTDTLISVLSRPYVQTVTVLPRSPYNYLQQINIDDGCEVPLFASGIPSEIEKERMRIYSFNSKNVKLLLNMALLGPAYTLIVPSNCSFMARLDRDGQTGSIPYSGGHGLVMSAEYPGYENYYPQTVSTSFSRQFVNSKEDWADFTIDIAHVDPGIGGNLSVAITYSGGFRANRVFTTIADNQTLSGKGAELTVSF